eukprot:NODE_91_length_21557_cov_0.766660.p7 type:complete len:360 gc:universal NODE_91_length_21557_cov_0.766660:3779-2700(-)
MELPQPTKKCLSALMSKQFKWDSGNGIVLEVSLVSASQNLIWLSIPPVTSITEVSIVVSIVSPSKIINKKRREMQAYDTADFPIACALCLSGDKKMIKSIRQCRVCDRSFDGFHWKPKSITEICPTCSKLKNCCQCCLMDISYVLPVQVIQSVMQIENELPTTETNKQYYLEQLRNQLKKGAYYRQKPTAEQDKLLRDLSRTHKHKLYNRKANVCTFWVRDKCNRGAECPYLHEKVLLDDNTDGKRIYRNRYFGIDDPLAARILGKMNEEDIITPPENTKIMTLLLENLPLNINETTLDELFNRYGEVKSVIINKKKRAAFINFKDRESAEKAATGAYNQLIIEDKPILVQWAEKKKEK